MDMLTFLQVQSMQYLLFELHALDQSVTGDPLFSAESEESQIISAFHSFMNNLMKRDSFEEVKKSQKILLDSAYQEANSRQNDYLTTSSKPDSQAHGDNIRSLKNFIAKNGSKLNTVFRRLEVPEVRAQRYTYL